MTALDIAPVIQGVLLADLESVPETPCEEDHMYFPCSGEVRWSAPPSPCGCAPRHLVCQASYDYVFDGAWSGMECTLCDRAFPVSEWRVGWCPV